MSGEEIKIIIVEDEWIISDNLKKHLLKNENYRVLAQEDNYNNAIISIKKFKPDIVLLDIALKGKKTGTDIGCLLNEHFPDISFIYITSIMDKETLEKAKNTFPAGYLTKPFNFSTVQTTIEIAINNFRHLKQPDIVEVEDGKKVYRFDLQKIKYIQSDKMYLEFYLTDNKVLIRNTLVNLLKILPPDRFVQINRSTIINRDFITEIKVSKVVVDNVIFKVSKTFAKSLS